MTEVENEENQLNEKKSDSIKEYNEDKSDFPYRIDWYQTDDHVVVTIFRKKENSGNTYEVSFTDQTARISAMGDGKECYKVFSLEKPIDPDKSRSTNFPSKVEMKMKKSQPGLWKHFELQKPDGGTQSTKKKNWDKVAKEIEEEKAEGEALLNQFFQDIYAKGSDEVKKAMIKSFTESGGTHLSTSWEDVSTDTVTIKPPEGMEWKPWDK